MIRQCLKNNLARKCKLNHDCSRLRLSRLNIVKSTSLRSYSVAAKRMSEQLFEDGNISVDLKSNISFGPLGLPPS